MNIGIKWPNDIYYNHKQKIGGIICQSTHNGRAFDVTIGVGINISNNRPTTCMDEIASQLQHHKVVLGRSNVLASFCNQFVEAIKTFRMYGFEPFLEDYMDMWLHTDEVVTVVNDEDEPQKRQAGDGHAAGGVRQRREGGALPRHALAESDGQAAVQEEVVCLLQQGGHRIASTCLVRSSRLPLFLMTWSANCSRFSLLHCAASRFSHSSNDRWLRCWRRCTA